jgi:hypothetical protein
MANNYMGLHDAVEFEMKGQKVIIDVGIVDLVWWFNQLPGVDTFTSCQGGSECCREDAYIGFSCADANSLDAIKRFVSRGRISEHNGHYELSLDVPELIRVNEERFPDSELWKNAFTNAVGDQSRRKQGKNRQNPDGPGVSDTRQVPSIADATPGSGMTARLSRWHSDAW